MRADPKPDLQQIKTIFERFRAGRVGKQRLPGDLWAAAVALLDHYPFNVVCRELRLKPDYLRKYAESAKGEPIGSDQKKPNFLALTGRELSAISNATDGAALSPTPAAAACRVVIERGDGSRLLLNLPVDWRGIEKLCSSF